MSSKAPCLNIDYPLISATRKEDKSKTCQEKKKTCVLNNNQNANHFQQRLLLFIKRYKKACTGDLSMEMGDGTFSWELWLTASLSRMASSRCCECLI